MVAVATAGLTHDVVLNGQGYMLAPGGYRRTTAPPGESLKAGAGIFRQRAWRARVVEAPGGADGESVWLAEGFLPVAEGAGLGIAPSAAWDTSIGTATTVYGGGADYNGVLYLAAGPTVYAVTTVTTGAPEVIGTYSGLSSSYTAANPVTSLVTHQGKLYAAFGSGYAHFNGTSWTTVSATAADVLGSYAGVLFRATGAALYWSADAGGTWYAVPLYEATRAFVGWGQGLLVITDRGFRLMTGRLRPSNPAGAPTVYDLWDYELQPVLEFDALVVYEAGSGLRAQNYRGRVYYWHGGGIWAWDGRTSARQPVRGSFLGMAQVGGYLVAAVATDEDGYRLWLHDGEGWWVLARSSSSTTQFAWPVSGQGVVKGSGLYAWNLGNRYLARWDFRTNGRVWGTGHGTPVVYLPAIDAGAPERVKQWTELGLLLGVPEGPSALSGSPATYHVEYSADAFGSYTLAGSVTPAALFSGGFFGLTGALARRLWVRVRVTGGGPNNPAVRAVVARWTGGVLVAARRRWELVLRASDQVVTLTGAAGERTGAALAADLAGLVGGGAVAFADVRHGWTGATHTVAVVEVEESAARNAAPLGAELVVRVVLEEVA